MTHTKCFVGFFIFIFSLTAISFAQSDNKPHNDSLKKDKTSRVVLEKGNNSKGTLKFDKDMYLHAINGYDPIAYFIDNKAEKGETDFTYNWMGAAWQFTNKTHMEIFKKNPEKYAPQFGGFSAFGVVNGSLIHTDGTIWSIEKGKLYLDVNTDYQRKFRENLKDNIKKGEENWISLSDTLK
jgi:YHS domain-containing protein